MPSPIPVGVRVHRRVPMPMGSTIGTLQNAPQIDWGARGCICRRNIQRDHGSTESHGNEADRVDQGLSGNPLFSGRSIPLRANSNPCQ